MQSNPEDTDNLSNDGVVRIAAKSMREGLNEVRKALGTDAIILAQEHFPNGVHIWATQDMEVAGRWQLSDTNEPTRDTAREPEAEPQPEPEITLQIEVPPIAEPAAATWADEARSLGFQPHHLETYPSATSVADLRYAMTADLTLHPVPGTLTGRLAFLGSPGCGKTTLLLKTLVASIEYQAIPDIAVVNCDQHKLGGGETIALACQIFGVESFDVAPENLEEFLPGLAHKKLVLIDTSPLVQDVPHTLPVSRVWVVSALLHPNYLERQWRALRATKPNYVALTHGDCVPDGDDLLRRLYQWRLPLFGVNAAAEFAVDLAKLDENIVYELLFGPRAGLHEGIQVAV